MIFWARVTSLWLYAWLGMWILKVSWWTAGYTAIKGQGIHRGGSGFNGEVSPTNKWRNQFSFPSSIGMLSQISETGSESLREGGPGDSSRLGIGISESRISGPGFHFNSWSDSFTSLKRDRENNVKLFPGSQVVALGLSHNSSIELE